MWRLLKRELNAGESVARPKKQIDEATVRKLAEIHCTVEEIASVVGCSKDTLERRFSELIEEGKAEGKSSLRRMQWGAAEKGNTAMLIWLGKQLLGQKDTASPFGDNPASITLKYNVNEEKK